MANGNRGRYRSKGRPPRGVPGVYRYQKRKTGRQEYVGETNDLRRRANEHKRDGRPFANPETHVMQWKPMDGRTTTNTRRKVERSQIEKHNPKYCQNAGGGGRIANRRRRKK